MKILSVRTRRWWLALLLAAATLQAFAAAPVPPAPARALVKEDLEPWLDGFVPTALQRGDMAGAVVVVVKDGRVLLQKGYGLADVASGRLVDPETTVFRPGSVSKLFMWTAVMQLVEQGHLDLDLDVNAYLDFMIPPFEGRPITMRNLMTHTAGFQESLKDLLVTDPGKVLPLATYIRRHLPARVYPAGEVPSYSNYGAALAGYIVQRVSRQPFEAYVDQHVFAPLGMRHSTFLQPVPETMSEHVSRGYELASEPARPYELFPAPAGNAAVTGADMARFMIAHLQDGQIDGRRVLQPATARLMHEAPFTLISPQLNRMALGFFELNRNGHRVIGHEGATRLFMSLLELRPDERVGLFISFNTVGRGDAARSIRSALSGGFADRYFPAAAARTQVPRDAAQAHAALLAGHYNSSQREEISPLSLFNLVMQTEVTADGEGRITASTVAGLDGQPRRFEEVAPWVWQEIGGPTRLAAKVVDGRVVMWSEGTDAPAQVYLPTPVWRDASWLGPVFMGSLGAVLATALLWPVGALVRRYFGAPPPLQGHAARAQWWARLGTAAAGLVMLAWLATIAAMVAAFYFSSTLDPWLMALHLLSIVVFPLAALATLWNAWETCRPGSARTALARVWSAAVGIACLVLLWVAFVFHLLDFSLAF